MNRGNNRANTQRSRLARTIVKVTKRLSAGRFRGAASIEMLPLQTIEWEGIEQDRTVVVDYADDPVQWSGHLAVCFKVGEGTGFAALPPFMPLLNLYPEEMATKSIRVIKEVVDRGEVETEIVTLFQQVNWQCHLPAAIATLLSPQRTASIRSLWSAFDHGSWVMPQLAVIAFLADPDFVAHATTRVVNLCPVDSPRGLSSFDNHRLRGPANDLQRSAKGINSLLALCAAKPDLADWHHEISSRKAVADLSNGDIDASGHIAIRWLEGLSARFASLGLSLTE